MNRGLPPLRYNISDWHQLPECKSNNSRELKLVVTDLIKNSVLEGVVIKVMHETFGVLFACTVGGSGNLLTTAKGLASPYELPTATILQSLEVFGFYITFNKRAALKGDQLKFLMTLDNLGYDKIRLLRVNCYEPKTGALNVETHIVAFMIDKCPNWLDNTCYEEEKTFVSLLRRGGVFDVSSLSVAHNYDWSWLDYVANIKDILSDNS